MQNVSLFRVVLAMSRKQNKWPRERLFAVTVDGKIFINARSIDGLDLVKLVRESEDVFVGLILRPAEIALLETHIRDACSGAASFIGGKRLWRGRRRRSRSS